MFRALRHQCVVLIAIAAPAVAHAGQSDAVGVYTLSAGRIGAIVSVLVGLVGAISGGLAVARSQRGNPRRRAILALVLGPISMLAGGFVVVTAGGGLGTGHGLGGGVVAMMVGLIGVALGGLALARSRRKPPSTNSI
jgi:Family of unknown function (DUF6223)